MAGQVFRGAQPGADAFGPAARPGIGVAMACRAALTRSRLVRLTPAGRPRACGARRGCRGAVGAGVPGVGDHVDRAGRGSGGDRGQRGAPAGRARTCLARAVRASTAGPHRQAHRPVAGTAGRPRSRRSRNSCPTTLAAAGAFRGAVVLPRRPGHPPPRPAKQGVIHRDQHRRPGRHQPGHDQPGQHQPDRVADSTGPGRRTSTPGRDATPRASPAAVQHPGHRAPPRLGDHPRHQGARTWRTTAR